MWTCNAQGVLESELLKQFPWVWHGFGTRLSGDWPGDYTSLKQIHSDLVHVAQSRGCLGEGDALVTGTPGIRIGVRTADCVPLLLAGSEHQAVAAVHAGWRGTIANIAKRAVQRMQEEFGSDPSRIHAALGPSIGQCCFEVGPEVAREFHEYFSDASSRTHIDLVDVNVRQLLDAGVARERIDISGICTVCDAERMHSFRRDKQSSGRMVAAIGIAQQ